jgi:hypothetical protein
MPNHWHTSPHTFYSAKYTSANSLAQAILPNHWHRQFCQSPARSSTYRGFCQITGKLLHIQAILPNHLHTVHRQTLLPNHWQGNSAKSLACSSTSRQFCQITGTLSTDRKFCQITGTCNSQTNNSAKSLTQAILPNHLHAPPHTCNSAKSLAHCPQTDTSAKSLAQVNPPNHWHTRQSCQITGMLLHVQVITSNQWHTVHR